MGIKNLKKFIRDRFPNEIQKMNLSEFYGKVFMMDIMSYIYKYKISMREKWLQSIIHLIKLFKYHNVHVNIVFEGESPVEKNKEKEQRRNQRKQQEQRIKDIKRDMDIFNETGFISDLLKNTCIKLNQTNNDKVNSLLHFDKQDKIKKDNKENKEITILTSKMIKQLQDFLDKKENQLVIVTKYDTDRIKEVCDIFGVPYFQSETEAETLCCKMCMSCSSYTNNNDANDNINETNNNTEVNNIDKEEVISDINCQKNEMNEMNEKNETNEMNEMNEKKIPIGVISEDSDVLAYGANMLVCDLNISNGECSVIYLPSLLKTMNLSLTQFQHFCVMCGSDYNKNIPGIGSVKCFEFIKKYKTISCIFENEEKLISKKIQDAIIKKKQKSLKTQKCDDTAINMDYLNNEDNEDNEDNENNEDIEDDKVDDNTTPEKLLTDMKRSLEMFTIDNYQFDQCDYWNSNADISLIGQCCMVNNIDSDNICKVWNNYIKLVK